MVFGRWTAAAVLFALGSVSSVELAVAQDSTDPPPFYKFTVVAKDVNAGESFPDFLIPGRGDVSINDRGWIAFRGRSLRFTTGGTGFVAVPSESGFNLQPFGIGFIQFNSLQINNQNYAVVALESGISSAIVGINLNDGTAEGIAPCGSYSAINNKNQVAFISGTCLLALVPNALATPDGGGGFNYAHLDLDSVSAAAEQPRPIMNDDGSVLIRAGNHSNSPIRLYSNDLSSYEEIAGAEFSRLGPIPAASENGQVVVFYGEDSNGPGIFASVRSFMSRVIVRIAGTTGNSPVAAFDPYARMAVNSTQANELSATIGGEPWQPTDLFVDSNDNGMHDSEQRAVTIAFVGVDSNGKKGVYTVRLNFFGNAKQVFDARVPASFSVSPATLVLKQGQVIPGVPGQIQDLALADSVNNRDRGDLALWVETLDSGLPMSAIVLARPQQIVYLDFDPVHNFQLTPFAAAFFRDLGINCSSCWTGNMADVFASTAPARTDLNGNADTIQNDIVRFVQQAFADLGINVKVLGHRLGGTTEPIPSDGPFVHVFIGDGPNTDATPGRFAGVSPGDLFNRSESVNAGSFSMPVEHPIAIQKTPLIFVDNLFRVADVNGDGRTHRGSFTNCLGRHGCTPTAVVSLNETESEGMIQFPEVEHAIADVVAHEVGHALGLMHLRNDLQDLIMNQQIDADEVRRLQQFSDHSNPTHEVVSLQNDRNRLALSAGSDIAPPERTQPLVDRVPRDVPSTAILLAEKRTEFSLLAPILPGSITVTRAVLGLVPFGEYDLMPELVDLGSGDLVTLLSRTIEVGPRDQIFLIASTTGNGIDIVGLAPGIAATTPIDLSNPLLVLTEPRIRGSAFDALGQPQHTIWQLVQLTPGGVVSLGAVGAAGALAPNLQSVAVTPADVEIAKSDTHQFTAIGTFTDGSTQDLTSRVFWSSSDESVASIAASGIATAIAAGTSTIEAAVGDLRASAALKVAGIVTRTERVSVSTVGTQADSESSSVSISADGRLVAFMSYADNLVSGDTNGAPDIFVRDRSSNTTERVSVSTTGEEAAPTRDPAAHSFGSFNPLISADGRFIAFDSPADNLVANDTNCDRDVFVHDRETGMTERVDVSGSGAQASLYGLVCNSNTAMFNQASSISGDGRFVAFLSGADNLVPGFRQSFPPRTFAYIRDRQAGTTEQIAQTIDRPALSADGRFVAFSSTRCGPDFVSRTPVVCVLDRIGGAYELISVSSAGDPADNVADSAAISGDGRFVAFASTAGNLVSNPGPAGIQQVYLRDRMSGVTQRMSVSDTGGQITGTVLGTQVDLDSTYPAIASDGQVAFTAETVVTAPWGIVVTSRVFLRDWLAGRTEPISVARSGATAEGGDGQRPRLGISADGRFVTFSSYAADLVVSDTNDQPDVFVRDRGTASEPPPPPPPPPPPSDTVPPVTTAALSSAAGAAGWNNSDTTVTLLAADNPGGSGVKNITVSAAGAQSLAATIFSGASAAIAITTEGTTTISFFATDEAGNLEAARTLVIRVDKSGPIIAGSRAPLANANGWNNTDVTVSFTCSDTLSGLAPDSPPADVVVSTEGAGQSVTRSCRDQAGNTSSATVGGINIDRTPPVITGSRTPIANSFGWSNSDVTVQFSCVDSLSGVAACGGSPQIVTTEGVNQSRTGTAADLAGNVASAVVTGINIDKTAPALRCLADPGVLWSPDHRLVPVSIVIDVADAGSGLASYTLLSAASNEPDNGLGDGDTAKDIQGWNIGTADVSGLLRAERSGLGSGRVYTLRYRGIDRAGNTGGCSVAITVPHDQY